MKRHLKYIFLALFAYAMTISCIEEIPFEEPMGKNQSLVLVPRVTGFANQYVTKAGYSTEESHISRLAVLVFNSDGRLVHMQQNEYGGSFTLNKSMLSSPAQKEKLASSTVVMIANIGLENVKDASGKSIVDNKDNLTLDGMEAYSFHFTEGQTVVTDISKDFAGFPMIGGVKGVDLRSTATQSAVEVGLKILYAKVKFSISVAAGTENSLNSTSFTLNGYSVCNTSKVTSVAIPTEKDEPVRDFLGNVIDESVYGTEDEATASDEYAYKTTGASGTASGTTNMNENKPLTFTFYVAESRYNHNCDLSDIYPEGWTTTAPAEDVKNYTDADAGKINGVKYFYDDLIQQYKPKLAEVDGASPGKGCATYVLLDGSYTDYRGEIWGVKYKVYLGKDNAQNFHVDRNSEYTNYITIKGIRNNDSYGEDQVWVDHRVDVSYDSSNGAADCVTITRETLIDSHIEVRPLRVDLSNSDYVAAAIYLPKYPLDAQGKIIYDARTEPYSWGQIQEIEGGQNENWIGMENNNGRYNKGKLYCSNGKRKYFTTTLIEELHLQNDSEEYGIKVDSQGYKYLQLSHGDCAWVYFDENLTSSKRRARIDVVFYKSDGSITESYDVYQVGLKEAGGYLIEEYEEYLHSYDSDDHYNLLTSPTDYTQQGLPWGMLAENESGELDGYKLSDSLIVKSVREGYEVVSERYDYYHSNDGSYFIFQKNKDASWSEVDKSTNTGLKFTSRASKKDNMTIIDMGTRPTSAYQYCLSKNKFNESLSDDKHSMIIHWYLPDIYEMKAILNATKTDKTLKDFAQGAYYWSSQPSFTTSLLQVVDEVDDYARAVSVTENQFKDLYRNEQHRIRCVRSTQGVYTDMSERVPDGLGGLLKIPMTVSNDGFFNYPAWITLLGEEPTDDYDNTPYRYPMGDTYPTNNPDRTAADSYFDGRVIDGVHYYTKNPLSDSNWGKINADDYTTYEAMHPENWPGLTSNKTEEVKILGASTNRYRILQDTPRTDKKTAIVRVGSKITSMPNVSSIALDHNEGSENLIILFNGGTNDSHIPTYEYYNETSASIEEWTKYWQVPNYIHTPAVQQTPIPCPASRPSYDEADIKSDIEEEYQDGWTRKRKLVVEGSLKFNYAETSYIYGSARDARSAAQTYFNSEINKNDRYEIISIETPSSSVQICTYSYKGQSMNYKLQWKDNGESKTDVSYNETKYSWKITYQTRNLYHYVKGTGGWDQGTKTQDGPTNPARSNVDKLTIYGGNTFTISAVDGYHIRSIKVNYRESNHIGTVLGIGRYLRLVDANEDLPQRNHPPKNMTYSGDGDQGWSKWTSSSESGGDQSVTLKLATYSVTTSVNIFGTTIPSTYEYVKPSNAIGYSSDFDTSIVIDSFEIRMEKVKNTSSE